MDEYKFPQMPLANAESIVSGQHYRFTILDDKVMRYEWSPDGVFEDRASTFAINRKFPKPEFRVEETENQLDIFTPTYHLTYDKQRFSPNGFYVSFGSKNVDWGVEWRYGTPAVRNLGGTARTIDGVDGRCDMGTGVISSAGYAVLDDTDSMLFDDQGFVAARRPGDRVDGYLFAYGYDFKGAMKSFYAISGSQPSVPRWCLGNWWSRYYAYNHTEYLALMDKFKANEIPLSVAVIDMDWHIVKGDNVPHSGWTGYTWNKDLFPDPEAFTKALHDRRLKVTLNDHPHAGVHHHEDIYEEMAKVLGHDTSHQAPILFDPTSPKFMHAYLNVLHRSLEKQGCDFWWIDWQQGPYSRIPGLDPLWLLNHFVYLDQAKHKALSEALLFSRFAGPGSHRYPIGFSGDAFATWDSLQFQPEFTATASNIGYGWWSHDIGGHMGGARDDELAVRWVQFGVFSPVMRLHSSNSRWMSKEPWLFRKESTTIIQNFMQLRHRLVPYIYSLIGSGIPYLPLVQPVYWSFPERDSAYKFRNQYYFASVLVAPIVEPRDRATNLAKTRAWIPPSRHVDIFTGYVYDGDQEIDIYRPLDQLPVFAVEGAIIPLDREAIQANGCPNPTAFEVLVTVGRDARFDIVEGTKDDEKSTSTADSQRAIPIEYNQAAGRVKFPGMRREWTFRFMSANIDPTAIKVLADGSALTEAQCTIESNTGIPSTVVRIPASQDLGNLISIDLGADPQLAVIDYSQVMSALILDFQISNDIKEQIWRIIQTDQPTTIKIARLTALQLESNWLGPLLELLLADSRSKA